MSTKLIWLEFAFTLFLKVILIFKLCPLHAGTPKNTEFIPS